MSLKGIVLALSVFSAVGCGLIGGLLFIFSNFMMKTLLEQPGESGIRTMQAVNVNILNPLFLFFFMGTAVASAFLAVSAVLRLSSPGSAWLLAGSLLYLIGVFGITLFCNVPLNNRLAAHAPETAEAARYWPVYVAAWLKWNHIRTAASLLASAALILAVYKSRLPGE